MKIMMLVLFGSAASAHEMTPTYFEVRPSSFKKICLTEFTLFNRRSDVSFYEVKVYDKDWNELPFSTADRIVQMKYAEKKTIPVYVRERDAEAITYICTESRLLKDSVGSTGVTSRICSKKK